MREIRILPRVLTGAAALLLAGYLMFTPVGALRLAMALSGHPVSAITMELTELSGGVLRNNSRRQYKVAVAGAPRVWTVTRCGVLYLACPAFSCDRLCTKISPEECHASGGRSSGQPPDT